MKRALPLIVIVAAIAGVYVYASRTPSELVLFPVTDSQRQGIEDMRLVWFVDDDGKQELYGTYTA